MKEPGRNKLWARIIKQWSLPGWNPTDEDYRKFHAIMDHYSTDACDKAFDAMYVARAKYNKPDYDVFMKVLMASGGREDTEGRLVVSWCLICTGKDSYGNGSPGRYFPFHGYGYPSLDETRLENEEMARMHGGGVWVLTNKHISEVRKWSTDLKHDAGLCNPKFCLRCNPPNPVDVSNTRALIERIFTKRLPSSRTETHKEMLGQKRDLLGAIKEDHDPNKLMNKDPDDDIPF